MTHSYFTDVVMRAMDRAIPLTAHLMLTYRCSQDCVHCYQRHGALPGEMTLDHYRVLLDDLASLGCLTVVLSGGEPMLRPDFLAIARAVRERHLTLRVFTNGQHLHDDTAKELAQLHPFSVDVSLYGATAEVHDAVSNRPGSFSNVVSAIDALRRGGIRVKVKNTLLSMNVHQADAVAALVRSLGATLEQSPYLYEPARKDRYQDLALGPEHLALLAHEESAEDDSCGIDPLRPWEEQRMCGAGSSYVAVDPVGNVLPCPLFGTAVGNVTQTPLADIWREAPLLKSLRAARKGDVEACRTCLLRHGCGRCVASVFNATGTLYEVDEKSCKIVRNKYSSRHSKIEVPLPQNRLRRSV